jgi:hypothetical protein
MQRTELTETEVTALRQYATTHGRRWKDALRTEWMNASAIQPLHKLRNTHGPSWLITFKLPAAAEATK